MVSNSSSIRHSDYDLEIFMPLLMEKALKKITDYGLKITIFLVMG
jgi:hypothetical protein